VGWATTTPTLNRYACQPSSSGDPIPRETPPSEVEAKRTRARMRAAMELAVTGATKAVQMQAEELAEHEFDLRRKLRKGRMSRR